ncbi:BnaC04g31250D [Brassica napus]|uniref:BnaC04g31250D protein n=1 Tax=Brassica napus TaxID=3708 RepID=A0A078HJM1_BRANA|nr:BnaC04g31250D [Brassica napus]
MVSALNVIDVSRVTPSDSPEPFTLSLTFFDLLWYKLHPVQRVIFYRLADATRPFFDSVIVPNLKSSLSSSLSHYLPLAGKLVWDSLDKKPSLKYSQNDAVSFTVAESNAEFSLLTGNKPFPTTELYPLVPELQVSDESASAVSFQVTLFPNQGFCIGVTAHHAVLDGKTTTMFLKFWANTCKRQQDQTVNASVSQDLIPIYDRTVIKAPGDIETKIMNQLSSFFKMVSGGKEPENPRSLKILPSQELTQLLSVAGSTRFGVYELDFGWGKPQRVVIVSIDQGEAISMAEGRDGNGGVEIGFSLKKHEMESLIDLLHQGLKNEKLIDASFPWKIFSGYSRSSVDMHKGNISFSNIAEDVFYKVVPAQREKEEDEDKKDQGLSSFDTGSLGLLIWRHWVQGAQ